ncbi:hypothetical protein C2G38_2170407 [Gigaspora rosea]|uniref:BTB domain-containing protein n=1 Tax=Gigaspora rosea TaxID=44941 RepID=A0A397VP55_9GLOM|nr:hypothetical protein C2G38_2170407 [Gigaspora rosea]
MAEKIFKKLSNNYLEIFDEEGFNVMINVGESLNNKILRAHSLLLVESGTVLQKLVLLFSESFEFKPEIFYSIGRKDLFFSRLQHLSLSVIPILNIENVAISLKVLAKNITTISSLNLEIWSDYEPQLFHSLFHPIIRIIKLQDQLKRFGLDGGDHCLTELHGIISALECQKNSLQEVIIKNVLITKSSRYLKIAKILKFRNASYLNYSSKMLNLLDWGDS